jgi:hypothetical protein
MLMLSSSCSTPFVFTENENGIGLSEDGNPVFYYQRVPKSRTGEYVCNNYLHPLYTLKGDTITEEFPADHLFHRGVFWAWHQLYAGEKNLGDGWINSGISYDIIIADNDTDNKKAALSIAVMWHSDSLNNGKPFIDEHTTITVHRKDDRIRKIDFEIQLNPLIENLQIGGSDDEKRYGGFCVRMKLPYDLGFASQNGPVKPQNLQIKAGPWMDFSAGFGSNGEKSGIAILCHPSNPDYPQQWILRQKGSMQNVVFPGRERFILDKPLMLRYRLIIHEAEIPDLDILQTEYENLKYELQ